MTHIAQRFLHKYTVLLHMLFLWLAFPTQQYIMNSSRLNVIIILKMCFLIAVEYSILKIKT